MNVNAIFEEWDDNETEHTTTLYFITSKSTLRALLGKDFPDAVMGTLTIEAPTGFLEARYAGVSISPTKHIKDEVSDIFEDYDWHNIELPADVVNDLIGLATRERPAIHWIRKLCYNLYMLDWKKSHITPEMEADNLKNYYEGLVDSEEEYTYEDFLEEFGFNGELYSSFEEFCNNEYRDEDYIFRLLENEELIYLYLADVREGK